MASSQAAKWIQFANPPFFQIWDIFVLNKSELLIVLHDNTNQIDGLIWTYNIYEDNYKSLMDEIDVECFELDNYYTTSLDNEKSLLYLFGQSGHITTINLKTKQCEISAEQFHDGSHSKSLFINGQFHIFGGWEERHKSHFIWDETNQNLVEIYKFKEIQTALYAHSVNYLKSRNSVLIIPDTVNKIYLYSLITHQCNVLPITINKIIRNPILSALTRNEDYLFTISGGIIFIFNLKIMSMRQSNICPLIKDGDIVIHSDEQKEETLSFGYIRFVWKLPEFSNTIYPPFYLIKLIDSYFANETLHQIGCLHGSIDVDIILQ